ncbi:carbohydrate kinase [Microbacteriaceae bacterium VKM Ac-2855]|nr:carbohydrate kinase [Microbacteriaceae bacterium VKM Ac-2855]
MNDEVRQSASAPILVIGEALIDIVERDGERSEHVGGSPLNVALTLARLGRDATLVADIAADAHGTMIREHLGASGVTVIAGTAERTPTALARIQPDGSARYEFDLTSNPPVPDPSGYAHVHTGSIAAFLEPGAANIRSLFGALPVGVTASLDPNIRASIIGPHAEVLPAFEALAARCDIVKLSDEDAEWLYPTVQLDEVLSRILELGARLAVITRGGEGLLLASAITRVNVSAARIVVADTIGAGDSAMGAIIDEALRGGLDVLDGPALTRIGHWAARVAGITTSRHGANPPLRAEVAPL